MSASKAQWEKQWHCERGLRIKADATIASQAAEIERLKSALEKSLTASANQSIALSQYQAENERLRKHIQTAVNSLKQANINPLPWQDRNAIGNALNELYTALQEATHADA